MRYLDEINAFYSLLDVNPLSTSAIVLWHALMHLCNKTGWKSEFNAANAVIALKTGLSIPAIHRARNVLKQSGLIDFSVRRGQQSTTYKIYSIAERRVKQTEHIPRQDKTKDREIPPIIPQTQISDEATMVIREYQNKISPVSSPKEQELLLDAIQHFSPDWVSRAIDVAAEYNAHSVQYVLSVLRRWEKEGGVDDGASRSHGRQNRKDAAGGRKKGQGNTVRTDWSDVPTSWDDVKI